MIVFHGSVNQIPQPVYGAGSPRNDYGKGFYCTEDIELAKEWACISGTDGYANQYLLDLDGLNVLNLNSPRYNILNWMALLAKNRTYWERSSISNEAKNYLQEHFLPDLHGVDVIRGYRADDSYFSFAKTFVSNGISFEQLEKAMKLGELGEQVVLISKNAFQHLSFQGASFAPCNFYTQKAKEKDTAARQAYRQLVKSGPTKNGLFMIDIMRRGMTNEDFN